MALWQIKLGENKKDWREFLANEHSIVTISYSINEDIRPMTDEEIEDHINKVQAQYAKSKFAIESYVRQTLAFKKDIKKCHYMVSPFWYLGNGNKYRIGRFVGKMGTLESLFEGDLDSFLKQHDKNWEECCNLPAWKVKWVSDFFPKSNIKIPIESKHDSNYIKGTVAELIYSVELPYELAPERAFLKPPNIYLKKYIKIKSWIFSHRILLTIGALAGIAAILDFLFKFF